MLRVYIQTQMGLKQKSRKRQRALDDEVYEVEAIVDFRINEVCGVAFTDSSTVSTTLSIHTAGYTIMNGSLHINHTGHSSMIKNTC